MRGKGCVRSERAIQESSILKFAARHMCLCDVACFNARLSSKRGRWLSALAAGLGLQRVMKQMRG